MKVYSNYKKIGNESESISTDITETERFIRKYYGQLYGNKIDNLDEIEKFLETHKL